MLDLMSKKCNIKDDFSYTDWEKKVLPDSNKMFYIGVLLISIAFRLTPLSGTL